MDGLFGVEIVQETLRQLISIPEVQHPPAREPVCCLNPALKHIREAGVVPTRRLDDLHSGISEQVRNPRFENFSVRESLDEQKPIGAENVTKTHSESCQRLGRLLGQWRHGRGSVIALHKEQTADGWGAVQKHLRVRGRDEEAVGGPLMEEPEERSLCPGMQVRLRLL